VVGTHPQLGLYPLNNHQTYRLPQAQIWSRFVIAKNLGPGQGRARHHFEQHLFYIKEKLNDQPPWQLKDYSSTDQIFK
jgi:hypothetical protein